MIRSRTVWLILAAALVLACQDAINAPGACPEFCAPGEIVVRDTVLPGSVDPLGSYGGYRLAHEAGELQIVGPGGPAESRAIIAFLLFSSRYSGGDTSVRDTIRQTDSLRFTFNVVRRNSGVSGVVLALHRLPVTIDTATSYADLAPYFEDSTLITTFPVPDTLKTGPVSTAVPLSALPNFMPDSLKTVIGVRISSPDPAYLSLGSADSSASAAALMTRFVQVDTSTGTKRVSRTDVRGTLFDTFVVDTSQVSTPVGLVVGGVPAARAFIKLNVPRDILDSTLIVRATLVLIPARAAFGAPGDTFRLRLHQVSADLGPKSPIVPAQSDTAASGSARIAVGSADSVTVDVTGILRQWGSDSTLPHTMMLRLVPEAASIDQFELATGPVGGRQPAVRVTYGLPFRLSGR